MKRFTQDILNIKRGDADVDKVYKGDIQVWPDEPVVQLLLDTHSNSTGAYSLRKLRTAYNGDCIRVRRSSDNTEQDIGFVDDVLDTTSLLSFVGSESGFVKTWYDQTGNNRDLSNFTGGGENQDNSRQPTIVLSGNLIIHNNKITLDFPNYHFLSFDSNIPNKSIFAVAKCNNTSTLNSLVGLRANALRADIGSNIRRGISGGANQYAGKNMPSGNPDDYSIYNNNDGFIFFNGVIHTTAQNIFNQHFTLHIKGTGSDGDDDGFTIGSTFAGGRNWRGFVSEMIVFNDDKTNERVDIETNINNFYQII